ncbi:unnamed protein product [Anisakis simplex]|uniref:Uncharacterized protein n=1 Tax=Anisakis simplex TaxID=6269 RepID=A0A3P6NSA1_ANISI|nr:unnamed protein product [Anisakis simplex]
MQSVLELPLSDEKFDFLCDKKIRESGIRMVSGVNESEQLCEITLGRLAVATAFGPFRDGFDDIEPAKVKNIVSELISE